MRVQLTKNAHKSYKIGMDEVQGLEQAMRDAFKPVEAFIRDQAYWERDNKDLIDTAEYKGRDGFIAHSHNCGGLILGMHIPKCEEYDWSFLEFGECDGCNEDCSACTASDPNGSGECMAECDGHLDAYLRIWFKFEGINSDGELEFYINACGGNGDAPYFRPKYLTDIFETSFTCKSVKGLKRASSKHIKALLASMKGA